MTMLIKEDGYLCFGWLCLLSLLQRAADHYTLSLKRRYFCSWVQAVDEAHAERDASAVQLYQQILLQRTMSNWKRVNVTHKYSTLSNSQLLQYAALASTTSKVLVYLALLVTVKRYAVYTGSKIRTVLPNLYAEESLHGSDGSCHWTATDRMGQQPAGRGAQYQVDMCSLKTNACVHVTLSSKLFTYNVCIYPVTWFSWFCRKAVKRCFAGWRRLPAVSREEKEREARREQLRRKVAEILPDFRSSPVGSLRSSINPL